MIKKSLLILAIALCLAMSAIAETTYLPGDGNNDGTVNILDAMAAARTHAALCVCVDNIQNSDVDGDGSVTIIDALLIARYSAGLINEFPVSQPIPDLQIITSDYDRTASPLTTTDEMEALTTGNNQFAFDLYSRLKQEPGNLMFSPTSISFAFAMCYAGANGSSEIRIAETMGYTLEESRLHNAFNALDQLLTTVPPNPDPYAGEDITLNIVNNTWGQKDYQFMPGYLDTLALNYGAGLYTLDFKQNPDKSRLIINDWISDVTQERIKDLLPENSVTEATRLILTNAIYFKAVWFNPFRPEDTIDGPFYLTDGGNITVPFMNQENHFAYAESPEEYQAIKLPYEGTRRNSMVIIMPGEDQFENFENTLTAAKFDAIYSSLTHSNVKLSMPKFSYEWNASLKTPLNDLGMTDPFDAGRADFSGITGNYYLYISDVLHKTFIAVDELGTEAAAATAIIMAETSIPQEPIAMTLNRPFIYAIYNDDSGSILFLGRVKNP